MMIKVVLAVALVTVAGQAYAKSCKDFATQAEAQAYFKAHNAKNLDRDNDGIACENGAGGKKASKKNKAGTTKQPTKPTNNPVKGKLPGQK